MGRYGDLPVGWGRGCPRRGNHRELIGDDLDAIAAGQGSPCCDRLGGKEAIVKGDRTHGCESVLVAFFSMHSTWTVRCVLVG